MASAFGNIQFDYDVDGLDAEVHSKMELNLLGKLLAGFGYIGRGVKNAAVEIIAIPSNVKREVRNSTFRGCRGLGNFLRSLCRFDRPEQQVSELQHNSAETPDAKKEKPFLLQADEGGSLTQTSNQGGEESALPQATADKKYVSLIVDEAGRLLVKLETGETDDSGKPITIDLEPKKLCPTMSQAAEDLLRDAVNIRSCMDPRSRRSALNTKSTVG